MATRSTTIGKESGEHETDAQARRRRLDALGALARQQPGTERDTGRDAGQGTDPGTAAAAGLDPADPADPARAAAARAAPASPARPSVPSVVSRSTPQRGRRWLVLGAAALGIVVIAAVVLRIVLAPPARHAPPSALTLDLVKGDITCPNAVSWSPDGSQVAIIGHTSACPSPFDTQYTAAAVNVYNATTGKLEQLIQPDQIIEPLIPIVVPTSGGPQGDVPSAGAVVATSGRPQRNIAYQGIAWSPDGTSLGLPFTVIIPVTTQQGSQQNVGLQTIASGIVVVRADGTNPQVLINTSDPASAMQWDLQGRTSTYLPTQAGNAFDSSLPLAAGYHWASGGTLSADGPYGGSTPDMPPPGPVGNPDGGASFTLWQPGTATYFDTALVNGQGIDENPGAFLAFTTITAWSPDGRYVVVIDENARMQPVGRGTPSAQALKDMQLDGMAVVPVRDKALQTVLTALLPLGQHGRQVDYAWRPDGRILAARQWPYQDQRAGAVQLYDTTTGAPVATLTPASKRTVILPGYDLLAWSPNGSHLLAVDAASGLVTIWGPGALPK